jgi:hypothetical protein
MTHDARQYGPRAEHATPPPRYYLDSLRRHRADAPSTPAADSGTSTLSFARHYAISVSDELVRRVECMRVEAYDEVKRI